MDTLNMFHHDKHSDVCIILSMASVGKCPITGIHKLITLWYASFNVSANELKFPSTPIWLCLTRSNNYFHHSTVISMAKFKTAISPLLTHWGYCSLALSHRHNEWFKSNCMICIWNFCSLDVHYTMRYLDLWLCMRLWHINNKARPQTSNIHLALYWW